MIYEVSDSIGCDAVLEDKSTCNAECTDHVLGHDSTVGMACYKACEAHKPWIREATESIWDEHAYEESCKALKCVFGLRLNARWN